MQRIWVIYSYVPVDYDTSWESKSDDVLEPNGDFQYGKFSDNYLLLSLKSKHILL